MKADSLYTVQVELVVNADSKKMADEIAYDALLTVQGEYARIEEGSVVHVEKL